MGDVVRHKTHAGGVEAGQRRAQEQRGAAGVERAQPLPVTGGNVAGLLRSASWIVGVGYGVQVGG